MLIPLSSEIMEQYKSHHRLKVFYTKGTKCVSCSRVATHMLHWNIGSGNHVDYIGFDTEEFLMTIDHIIPVSKGGEGNIENLQPMCLECNMAKGDK